MSLDSLRDLSIAIISSSLSHPLGLAKLPSTTESALTPKERRVLDLQRDLELLSAQIVEARESSGLADKRSSPLCVLSDVEGRRILGEAGVTDASLLGRLEVAQTEYFKARQENANKDVISQSLLRVNPTLKTIHASRNTLNSAERNLLGPISRRNVLSSQLLKVSLRHTELQEKLAALQVQTLGMSYCDLGTDRRYDEGE